MDEADLSDKKIQDVINDGINEVRRNSAKQSLSPCGSCFWCQEKVGSGKLFCDFDCAKDWEHDRERRKTNGLLA